MTHDRHLAETFGARPCGTARRLRHSVHRPRLSSVLEAWSHCGETVPRSEAHAGVITFWALFAHSVADDGGMTSMPICMRPPRRTHDRTRKTKQIGLVGAFVRGFI